MQVQTPARQSAGWGKVLDLGEKFLRALFTYDTDGLSRVIRAAWMVGLLVFGLLLWGKFYSWGSISLDFLDWAEVTGPRYALLQDAVTKGQLPLHAENITALRGATDRYFAIPDTPFSPQILLLRFLEIGRYLFVDTMLFYLLGFAGLVLIARRYKLSPVVFFLLFLLFNFNGHITTHLAVGHSIWTSYFLLPYYVLLIMRLVEQEQVGWRWVLGLSLLLLVMLLQGSFHQYVWCLMFLGVLALLNLRLLKPVLLGGLFSVLLGLPRLLPPALALNKITHEYMGGFATVADLFNNMIVMRDPDRSVQLPSNLIPLSWWEQDYFIGLLGFAFLLIFGVLWPLWKDRSRGSAQMQILLACLVFAAFSIGQVFAMITRVLPVPPLTGERVTSRMFSLPLVFLLVLAAVFLQRFLEERRSGGAALPAWVQVLILGVSGLAFHDLYQHLEAWRIRYLDGLVYLYPKLPFDAAQHAISNHPDPIYTDMLLGGAAAALAALVFLILMAVRERRKAAKA